MNEIVFGERKGIGQKVGGLFWYCLRDEGNDDKMISPVITVYDKFIIILSQYMREKYASDKITFWASGSFLISFPFSPQRLLHLFLLEPKHRKKK